MSDSKHDPSAATPFGETVAADSEAGSGAGPNDELSLATSPTTLLGETVTQGSAATEGSRRTASRSARSSSDLSGPGTRSRAAGQTLIESGDQDFAELQPVDPDNYVAGYELDRGGMGRIWAARDRRLGREVAIKELIDPHAHEHSPHRAARFEREARITAKLQHPAIVNVHEAGRWPSGQPFYAMKMVAGRSLATLLANDLDISERLALLPKIIAIAQAMAYAHSQHIIHRDLKPSNVLVGEFGETVVIDWGLAKNLAEARGDDALFTESSGLEPAGAGSGSGSTGSLTVAGSVMGTPAYMPPEQAAGKEVDERADVYALGAILYHLLTGEAPYRGKDGAEIIAQVVREAPLPVAEKQADVAEDLQTIVAKAMARDTEERYRTARELADDLERFRTGQLVAAHTYSTSQRIRRLIARHRGAAAVAAAALVIVAIMGVVSVQRVVSERDRAEAERAAAAERANQLTVVQAHSLLESDPSAALELLAKLPSDASSKHWQSARLIATGARFRGLPTVLHRDEDDSIATMSVAPDGTTLAVAARSGRIRLWDLARDKSRDLGSHGGLVRSLDFSRDSRFLASGSHDNTVGLWNLETGEHTAYRGHQGLVLAVRFLPNGEAIVSAGLDGTVRVWPRSEPATPRGADDAASPAGTVLRLQSSVAQVLAVAPGSSLIAVAGEGWLTLWNWRDNTQRALDGHDGQIHTLEFSPDGRYLAAAGKSSSAWVWHLDSGRRAELTGHGEVVANIAFVPVGSRVATTSFDHTAALWDLADVACLDGTPETPKTPATEPSPCQITPAHVLRGHGDEVVHLAFSPDATQLATSSRDRTVRIWSLSEPGREPRAQGTTPDGDSLSALWVLSGHEKMPRVAYASAGRAVITASPTTVRAWRTGNRQIARFPASPRKLAVSPDKTEVAVMTANQVIRWSIATKGASDAFDTPASQGQEPWIRSSAPLVDMAISPSGEQIATVDQYRRLRVWSAGDGSARGGEPAASREGAVARTLPGFAIKQAIFSPNGALIAAPSETNAVRLWHAATGETRILTGYQRFVESVLFSADGGLLATSSNDGGIRVWDTMKQESRQLTGHDASVLYLALDRRATILASGDERGTVKRWDLTTGEGWVIGGAGGLLRALDVSPDGSSVVWVGPKGAIHYWSRKDGEARVLEGNDGEARQAAFSPDGTVLAVIGDSPRVWLWDAGGHMHIALPGHQSRVQAMVFAPDSSFLATISAGGTGRLWPLGLPGDPSALRALFEIGLE